jgi:hypothetical protein
MDGFQPNSKARRIRQNEAARNQAEGSSFHHPSASYPEPLTVDMHIISYYTQLNYIVCLPLSILYVI